MSSAPAATAPPPVVAPATVRSPGNRFSPGMIVSANASSVISRAFSASGVPGFKSFLLYGHANVPVTRPRRATDPPLSFGGHSVDENRGRSPSLLLGAAFARAHINSGYRVDHSGRAYSKVREWLMLSRH